MKNSQYNELRWRLYTTIGLFCFTYGSIFHTSYFVFIILQTILLSLIAWEWIELCAPTTLSIRLLYLSYLEVGYLSSIFLIPFHVTCIISLIMSTSLILYVFYLTQQSQLTQHTIIFKRSVGIVALVIAWRSFLFLKLKPYYFALGLLTVGLTDTSAYLIGKRWGYHPCTPIISPHKTWEGYIAGFSIPIIISLYLLKKYFYTWHLHPIYWVITIVMTTLTALAGDLFESQIKRERNLKDSGHILPGHGGFADRFDSIITSISIFASGLYWIQNS